jgi:hypothetical protein
MGKVEELVGLKIKQCGAFLFSLSFCCVVVVVLLLCLHFILFMPNGPNCKINKYRGCGGAKL